MFSQFVKPERIDAGEKNVYNNGSNREGSFMSRIKLIAFDLDGTLCNTLKDIAASLNYALAHFGFPTFSDSEVSQLVGKSVVYMCRNAVPKGHEDDWEKLVERWHVEYAAHLCDTTVPYEGMPETLKALHAQGVRLACVTNKPHRHAVPMLQKLFPPDGAIFSCIQGQSPEYPTKPDPFMMDMVREKLGFTREETLYVGDMDVDVQFAKNSGLKFAGCDWGFRGEAFLREAGAEIVLKEPKDLLGLLKNMDQ